MMASEEVVSVGGMKRPVPRVRDDAYYIKAAESPPSKVVSRRKHDGTARPTPSPRDRELVSEIRRARKRSA